MAEAKKISTPPDEREFSLEASSNAPAWMTRCKYYMLEFLLAMVAILVSAFVLDRTLFALGHYIADKGSNAAYDEMNLMVVALGLVWLPVAILFFKRSRHEEINRPEVASTKLRRFFLYSFMLIVAVSALSFKVAAIYSLLQIAFGAAEVGDTLIATTVPALLAAWVHAYVFWTFMKSVNAARIKQFTTFFGGVGLILVLVLFAVTAVQARGALVDEKITDDLTTINQKVNERYGQTGNLPEKLDELGLDKDVTSRISKHNYTYEKKGDRNYTLCADFKSESKGDGKARIMIYPPVPDFSAHKKGKHCFDLNAGYDYYPMPEVQADGAEPSMGSDNPMQTFESLLKEQTDAAEAY